MTDEISDKNKTIAQLQTAELTQEQSSIDNLDEVNHTLELQKLQHKEQIGKILEEIDSKNTDLASLREKSDRLKADSELKITKQKNKIVTVRFEYKDGLTTTKTKKTGCGFTYSTTRVF